MKARNRKAQKRDNGSVQRTAVATRLPRAKDTGFREGRFQAADGTEIVWNATGDGQPLVLCDGIGCDQYAWKYLVPHFQDQYTLIRWNYRGHGKSATPKDMTRLRMEDVRQDLHQLIDHIDLGKPIMVGHSMGVQVVLDYAAHRAGGTAGLVLMCGAPGRPLTTFHDSDRGDKIFPHLLRIVQRFPKQVRALWRLMLTGSLPYEVAIRGEVNGDFLLREDFMPYFTHLRERMDPVVFFTMLGSLNSHDVSDYLPQVDVPTLIIAGERDTFTPAWLSERMHAQIPESELLFLPGGSHTAPIEFPQIVNARVARFLSERF
jgi:pimeloyl-ACP methyl ester carboxylesterase